MVVSINIDEMDWREFLKQSIDMKISASKRVRNFIKKEISKNANKQGTWKRNS